MTDNPYQPPAPSGSRSEVSLWQRVVGYFSVDSGFRNRFLQGDPFVQNGVVLFVDPDDNKTIYAALPLLRREQAVVDLCIEEAKTELGRFLQDYEILLDDIKDRNLIVRFIHSYSNLDDHVVSPITATWKPLRESTAHSD